ncbi:MAG: MoxR family ATPase [Chloroflexi bacterium]|nr:MoxR family ATPase [Chloroflexota bacterium]
MRADKISGAFAEIRQALDRVTVGYDEFKDALVTALVKQTLGIRGGHVLVFGPTGTAKTRTTKGLSRILNSLGMPVPYARISGNPNTMPADFLMRRVSDYDESGRPQFAWELQAVQAFEKKQDMAFPGLFQFDELDKITPKAQHGLLEVMEEQQVTIPKQGPVGLNFTLVATANTRKFDPTAQPLGRAIQDRFGSVVLLGYQTLEEDFEMLERNTSSLREPEIRLNHFPVTELEEIRTRVQQSGLPVRVSADMKRRITTAVKLTQQKIDGFTDFTRYIKVPCGPRGILDLFWEAGVSALLSGTDELTADYPLRVGLRVLRGRVETTPEAEMDGMTTDVVITKILAEVFADAARSASRPQMPHRNSSPAPVRR